MPGERFLNGSIAAKLTVRLYQGGEVYARVRQAKETLGQAKLKADLQRDMIRASVVSSWGQLDRARAVIQSSKAAIKSAEIALDGIRQEAEVGQRTTFAVSAARLVEHQGQPCGCAARPGRCLICGHGCHWPTCRRKT